MKRSQGFGFKAALQSSRDVRNNFGKGKHHGGFLKVKHHGGLLYGVRGRAGLDFDNLLFTTALNSDRVNYMCYFCICLTFCITSSGCVPMKFKAAFQSSPGVRNNCTRGKTS